MRYINADKLYEKVDVLMAHYAKAKNEIKDDAELSIFYQGRMQMCSEILDIIYYLQQETPKTDLEKEIDKKIQELHITPCYSELKNFAVHFYRLGLNARKKDKK